jgi:hypothetical protein
MPPEVLKSTSRGYNAMFFDIWSLGDTLLYNVKHNIIYSEMCETIFKKNYNFRLIIMNTITNSKFYTVVEIFLFAHSNKSKSSKSKYVLNPRN